MPGQFQAHWHVSRSRCRAAEVRQNRFCMNPASRPISVSRCAPVLASVRVLLQLEAPVERRRFVPGKVRLARQPPGERGTQDVLPKRIGALHRRKTGSGGSGRETLCKLLSVPSSCSFLFLRRLVAPSLYRLRFALATFDGTPRWLARRTLLK